MKEMYDSEHGTAETPVAALRKYESNNPARSRASGVKCIYTNKFDIEYNSLM